MITATKTPGEKKTCPKIKTVAKLKNHRNNLAWISCKCVRFKCGKFGKKGEKVQTRQACHCVCAEWTLVWPWALSHCKNRLSRCWDIRSIQVRLMPTSLIHMKWMLMKIVLPFDCPSQITLWHTLLRWFPVFTALEFQISPFCFERI